MGKCGVLHLGGNSSPICVRRLACRAISAAAELHVTQCGHWYFLSVHSFLYVFYDFNRKVDQVPIFFSGMLQTCSVVDDKSSEHTIIVLHPGWVDTDVSRLYISINPSQPGVIGWRPRGLLHLLGRRSNYQVIGSCVQWHIFSPNVGKWDPFGTGQFVK